MAIPQALGLGLVAAMSQPSAAAPIPRSETITLRAGTTEIIRFDFHWAFDIPPQWQPPYTVGFKMKNLPPFGGSGGMNPEGFHDLGQQERFRFSISYASDYACQVHLTINNASLVDGGTYEAKVFFIPHISFSNEPYISSIKTLNVSRPPEKAKCYVISRNFQDTGLHEFHCHTSADATLSCFQNGAGIPYVGYIFNNGKHTKAVFLIKPDASAHCCSHFTNQNVTQSTCNDFEIPVSDRSEDQMSSQTPKEINEGGRSTTTEKASMSVNSGCYGYFHLSYTFIILIYKLACLAKQQ